MKNKMTIFGCGGAGINIAFGYQSTAEGKNPPADSAIIDKVLLDTSYSNVDVNDKKQMDCFYRFDDASIGSGGLRGENFDPIRRGMKDFLIKNPPTDVNLVVFSASGGSGSTIGPVLVQELLAMDEHKPVVVITFLDWSNELRTRNSFNTIRTLENIAESTGKPVVIYPIHNESRVNADIAALNAIYRLSVLFSNTHAELDNADTYNFINYNRVTNYPPKVAALNIHVDNNKPEDLIKELKGVRPTSVAMIHSDATCSDRYKTAFVTGYSCEGFASEPLTVDAGSVIYMVDIEEIRHVKAKLDSEMKIYLDATSASIDAVSKDDKPKNIKETAVDGNFVF